MNFHYSWQLGDHAKVDSEHYMVPLMLCNLKLFHWICSVKQSWKTFTCFRNYAEFYFRSHWNNYITHSNSWKNANREITQSYTTDLSDFNNTLFHLSLLPHTQFHHWEVLVIARGQVRKSMHSLKILKFVRGWDFHPLTSVSRNQNEYVNNFYYNFR